MSIKFTKAKKKYLSVLFITPENIPRINTENKGVTLSLYFNPFAKIALGRTGWNVVDTIVAAVLIISLFGKKGK